MASQGDLRRAPPALRADLVEARHLQNAPGIGTTVRAGVLRLRALARAVKGR